MDLVLSEEQELLSASARRALDRLRPAACARAWMAGDASPSDELWRALAELGWQGISVPERFGGSGKGALETALLLEELGRALAPVPFLPSVLVAQAIDRLGDEAQRSEWLPRFASGELRATLACTASLDRPAAGVRASAGAGGWTLSGEESFVPDASSVDAIAVAVRIDGEAGVAWFLVPRSAAGLEIEPMRSLDPLRALHRLRFDGVIVGARSRLAGEGGGAAGDDGLLDLARVLVSAEMVGGAQRCLESAIEYARARVQFGHPIGAYQAIQHRCADVLVRVECARWLARSAAAALAGEAREASLSAAMAKSTAGDAYRFAAEASLQIHGGIGYTWDSDCHLHLKRALGDECWLGDADWHRERIARLLEA